jgi:VTC domain-containing protein
MRARLDTDALITAERQELKYLVDQARAQTLVRVLSRQLPRHRFTGEGANRLPQPRHYVTTVYFDTPARELYDAAVASENNLKLRAKEYYDLHPHLAETATDPRQLVRYRPSLWLELKHKDGTRTGKSRLGIPKRDVPGFFADGVVTLEMLRIQERIYGEEGEQLLREAADLVGRFRDPLRADCLVNYRRVAWQDDPGTLRVTIDLGLACFAPPEDLWHRDYALVRETLGVPAGVENRCVLEIKSRGPHPPWLASVLEEAGAVRAAYSKFETASRAVHG